MELFQKRIVITRPRAQAEDFATVLLAEGAIPVFIPAIKIIPPNDFAILDAALHELDQYDWLLFTSIHAVDAFFGRLYVLGIKNIPQRLHVAVVGPKTTLKLAEYHITPNLVPDEYSAKAILLGLGKNISGMRFLFPQSNLTRNTPAKEIRHSGGVVDEIIAYHNVRLKLESSALDALRNGVDIVTFASPSSVHAFIDAVGEHGFDIFNLPGNPLFACIGPSTAATAREAGLPIFVEAQEHTIDGLISALKKAQPPK